MTVGTSSIATTLDNSDLQNAAYFNIWPDGKKKVQIVPPTSDQVPLVCVESLTTGKSILVDTSTLNGYEDVITWP